MSPDSFEMTSLADKESVKFEVTPHTGATLLPVVDKITTHIFSLVFFCSSTRFLKSFVLSISTCSIINFQSLIS